MIQLEKKYAYLTIYLGTYGIPSSSALFNCKGNTYPNITFLLLLISLKISLLFGGIGSVLLLTKKP